MRTGLLLLLAAVSIGFGAAAISAPPPASEGPPPGVVADCDGRSMAQWPESYENPENVVAGPLALIGAAFVPAATIREFGGNKLAALVRPGHRVTIALTAADRQHVALAFGPLPDGEIDVEDGYRAVTFVPCGPGETSGSSSGTEPVTFWMGAVVTDAPRCVTLDVWIDDAPAPQRVPLRLGSRDC